MALMRAIGLAIGALTFATGCATRAPAPEQIGQEIFAYVAKPTFNEVSASEKVAGSKLGEDFQAALHYAVRQAPEVIAAQSSWREASAEVKVAASASKPQTELSANAGGLREDFTSGTRNTVGASANLSINQLIYDGGATTARLAAAQITAAGANLRLRDVATRVALDAASAWVDYQTAITKMALLESYLNKGKALSAQLKRLTTSGMADKSVAISAEMDLRDLDLEKTRLGERLSEAHGRLSRFFPMPLVDLPNAHSPFDKGTEENLQSRWRNAPALHLAAADVLRARQELLIAQAARQPTIGFRAGVNSPMSRSDSTDYMLGLQAHWTLGDGGRRAATIKAAKHRLIGLENTFISTKESAKRELETSLSQKSSLRHSLELLHAQLHWAENQRDTVESQMATGQSSIRQLVDANIRAYRIEDQIIEFEAQLLTLDLIIASGTGILLDWIAIDFDGSE